MDNPIDHSLSYRRALEMINEGDYVGAYRSLRPLLNSECPPDLYPRVALQLGFCCRKLGENDKLRAEEGLEYLLKAYELLDPKIDGFDVLCTLDLLGTTFWILSRLAESRRYYEEGLKYIAWYQQDKPELREREYRYYIRLAEVDYNLGNWPAAQEVLERISPIMKYLSPREEYEADFRFRIGRILHFQKKDDAALPLLQEIDLSKLDIRAERSLHFVLMRIFNSRAQYVEVVEEFEKLRVIGFDESAEAYVHCYVGKAYFQLGRSHEASKAFERALECPAAIGEDWVHARSKEYLRKLGALDS